MLTLIDIIATAIEAGMLPILLKKNTASSAIQNTIPPCSIYFVAVQILTMNQLSPSVKLLFLLGLDVMLAYTFYKSHLKKACIFSILHFICIYTGEMTLQVLLLIFFLPAFPIWSKTWSCLSLLS